MKPGEALWQDDGRMSGAVCFRGNRVPVEFVFHTLADGTMEEFYMDRPKSPSKARSGFDDSPRRGIPGARVGRPPLDRRSASTNHPATTNST